MVLYKKAETPAEKVEKLKIYTQNNLSKTCLETQNECSPASGFHYEILCTENGRFEQVGHEFFLLFTGRLVELLGKFDFKLRNIFVENV